MNPEPQKFFVGLIDFFSVWLPGALLAYVLQPDLQPLLVTAGYPSPGTDTERWIVFLLISFILGHFVFLLGSVLLDPLYVRIREGTPAEQERLISSGRKPSSWLAKWISRHVFKEEADEALRQATAIKRKYLNEACGFLALNTFQWCKACLALGHPQALAIVHRFEADSKFFRSLCIVLFTLAPWVVVMGRPAMLVVILPFLGAAVWRFMEQRGKARDQAYWFMIALEGERCKAENA